MHDCIQCGCACYCHGDIDDCVVETWQYSAAHCTGCGCHEDPDAFEDDEYDEPESAPADGARKLAGEGTEGT